MAIHVQMWMGSGNARVTDMTNAGKRGKFCRALRIQGTNGGSSWTGAKLAADYTYEAVHVLRRLPEFVDDFTPFTAAADFDRVMESISAIAAIALSAGVSPHSLDVAEEMIKGIRAPRPVLTAGRSGLWSARADIGGIHLRKLDDVNEWTEITPSSQSSARAYEIAARVWPSVQAAISMHAASDILSRAGARLHGYCAMD